MFAAFFVRQHQIDWLENFYLQSSMVWEKVSLWCKSGQLAELFENQLEAQLSRDELKWAIIELFSRRVLHLTWKLAITGRF